MNLIGQQIDQYLIEAFIASGGMAEVYLARDVDLDRPVALKIMRLELARQEGFIARFQREARTIARLQHPNIVQIYSTGTTPNGQPYLAMQYVAGGTLQAQLERMTAQGQRLQPTAALQMMQQVAEALATAHAAGIIHRDLKPSNILLDSTYRPIVTDFGIAAVDTATTRLTQTGIVMGTPFYMSPEQIQGQGNVNGRSDIYTLGVILYELLAGRVPFLGPNTLALMHQHVYEPPPPLTEFAPHLTPTTIHLVNHCLAKEPEKRPLTAVNLSQSL
ncbi:MAG: serine/threonine protein kinase, partial [Anaerolineales bacterium]|nr:serine/threonine protein kinase [Anaerolineales bacterium]